MKLVDILSDNFNREDWEEKGYILPKFDIKAVREKTYSRPSWVHFGAGNIFRALPTAMLQKLLDDGIYDRGIIAAESYASIDDTYKAFDNLSILVTLCADGSLKKKVLASVTEALKADYTDADDWNRLVEIFENRSLQLISFTITEKGYAVPPDDLSNGLKPEAIVGKVAALLYKRFEAGAYPVALQSMDNCARNGDVLRNAVITYAKAWENAGLAQKAFLDYLSDENRVAFPWSMVDKITPYPDENVRKKLVDTGLKDCEIIVTDKGTHTGCFVNAEEAEYLVVEDKYPAGKIPLDKAGVIFTDRETVEKVEKMKVGACLNPLHTALAIFGCLLGYTRISDEMKDRDLAELVTRMSHLESLPVVRHPGIIDPKAFMDEAINKRLPNPFLPDTPQRIATDTSQKIPVRFGGTIKAYNEQGLDLSNLHYIPLVLAGYARYLKAVDDEGKPFTLSPDPLLSELTPIVSGLVVGGKNQDMSVLRQLYTRADIFGVDLYSVGLGEKIEKLAAKLYSGVGAVRETIAECLKSGE